MPKQLLQDIQRLVAHRKNERISREAVARELGVSSSTIYRWEKGRCAPTGLAKQHLEAYLRKEGV